MVNSVKIDSKTKKAKEGEIGATKQLTTNQTGTTRLVTKVKEVFHNSFIILFLI
jgi:hypothetical protein